jgi:hypothetical protein
MLTHRDQAVFRPIVSAAWVAQCRQSGSAPNDRAAQDRWYREQLMSACQIASTKDATGEQMAVLLDHFQTLADAHQCPWIEGWTDSQNKHFSALARAAFHAAAPASEFPEWIDALLASAGILEHFSTNKVKSFDAVMSNLAIMAYDLFWIERTSGAPEIRMRHVIREKMAVLAELLKRPVDWSYVTAIWTQAALLPSIDDAPAGTLRKILQMLDTHIRRVQDRPPVQQSECPF